MIHTRILRSSPILSPLLVLVGIIHIPNLLDGCDMTCMGTRDVHVVVMRQARAMRIRRILEVEIDRSGYIEPAGFEIVKRDVRSSACDGNERRYCFAMINYFIRFVHCIMRSFCCRNVGSEGSTKFKITSH